jgi:hypothetical protein
MAALLRRVLALVVLLAATSLGDAEEQVTNPFYQLWSNSKPGAAVVRKETTKLSGATAAYGAVGHLRSRVMFWP